MLKILETGSRLENVWKNVWSKGGEMAEKSLDLGSDKKKTEHLSGILSRNSTLALNESRIARNGRSR